jgi:hypothetical protein
VPGPRQPARVGALAAVSQCGRARGARHVVEDGGASPLPRASRPIPLCGRCGYGLRAGRGRPADHRGVTETVRHVRAGDHHREAHGGPLRAPTAIVSRSPAWALQRAGLCPLLGHNLARQRPHQAADGGQAAPPHPGRVLAVVPGQPPPSTPGTGRLTVCEAARVLPVGRRAVPQPLPRPGVLCGHARVAVRAQPPWRPEEDVASVWAEDGGVPAAAAQERARVGRVPGMAPATGSHGDQVCWSADGDR